MAEVDIAIISIFIRAYGIDGKKKNYDNFGSPFSFFQMHPMKINIKDPSQVEVSNNSKKNGFNAMVRNIR